MKTDERNFEEIIDVDGDEKQTPSGSNSAEEKGDQTSAKQTGSQSQNSTTKKRGRGRPKKSEKQTPKTSDQKPENKEEKEEIDEVSSVFDAFNDVDPDAIESTPFTESKPDTKPRRKRGRPPGSKNKTSSPGDADFSISGEMLLSGINFLGPFGIKTVYSMIDKRGKLIDANNLKLDKSEKDELREAADHVAGLLTGKLNPVYFFIFSLLIIFGSKLQQEVSSLPKTAAQ